MEFDAKKFVLLPSMEVLGDVQDFLSRVISARKQGEEGLQEMPNIRAKVSSRSARFVFFFNAVYLSGLWRVEQSTL